MVVEEVEVEEVIQQLLVELVDQVEDPQKMLLLDLHLKVMLVVLVLAQGPMLMVVVVVVLVVPAEVLAVHLIQQLLMVVLELDFLHLSKIHLPSIAINDA